MQDAVIISTARTPIAKAFRGAFNDLKSPSMAAVAIRAGPLVVQCSPHCIAARRC